jgi:hypothetical protein
MAIVSLVALEIKSFSSTVHTNTKWVYNFNITAALWAAGAWQSHRLGLKLQLTCEAEE